MKAVFIQEQEWYDINNVEALPSQLNSNLAEIETGTGVKFGVTLYGTGIALGSTWASFYFGYLLTLPMIFIWIIILGIGGAEMILSMRGEASQRQAYSKSGAQAEQSFNAIKIVKAFGQEKAEWNKFSQYLSRSHQTIQKYSWTYGLSKAMLESIVHIISIYGFILCGIFAVYQVMFVQIIIHRSTIQILEKTMMVVI